MTEHEYGIELTWTGNLGSGTSHPRDYARDHSITAEGMELPILGSAAPIYRGDPSKWNPELLLVAAVSECHMLWYLHFCAVNGIVVESYIDKATGTLDAVHEPYKPRFVALTLHPEVVVADSSMMQKAQDLHEEANAYCFVANSLNFPVLHEPIVAIAG